MAVSLKTKLSVVDTSLRFSLDGKHGSRLKVGFFTLYNTHELRS